MNKRDRCILFIIIYISVCMYVNISFKIVCGFPSNFDLQQLLSACGYIIITTCKTLKHSKHKITFNYIYVYLQMDCCGIKKFICSSQDCLSFKKYIYYHDKLLLNSQKIVFEILVCNDKSR